MALTFRSGLLLSQLPHRVRIWRRVEGRTHDRGMLANTFRDPYGDDIPVRLRPDMMMFDAGIDGTPGPGPMTCDMPARDSNGKRIRIHTFPPDVLEIKWTRQRSGRRDIVETTLTANAAAGTTALTVADSWGFEPEDLIVLQTAANNDWQCALVESVVGDIVNLRSTRDVADSKSFSSGDTVKVAWTAEVTGVRNPLQSDHLHIISLRASTEGRWLLE